METLDNYDMFTAGNKQQYKQIAKRAQIKDVELFAENCVIRGGCFFSKRKNAPVAGVLSNGKNIEFKEFINRL